MTDEQRAEWLREWMRHDMEWGDWDLARRAVGRAYETYRILLGRARFCRARIDPADVASEYERLAEAEAVVARDRDRLIRATLKLATEDS